MSTHDKTIYMYFDNVLCLSAMAAEKTGPPQQQL
jgi:hypothetical protein